jgi:hypothetical protein
VKARGFGLPFTGFPSNATLAQALRPYPQFNAGLGPQFAPLGTTSYNSLQAKVTKRLSHGIDFTYAFTYQKSLVFGSTINDVWNRSANDQVLAAEDQPLQSVIAFTYNVPRMHGINKILAYALYDWQVGGLPGAQNNLATVLFQSTRANRVPGQPLFLKDLNSHVDPRTDFVLNPLAWSDPAPGQWGGSAPFYNDFRYQRRPNEALNFGRNFQVGERVTFQARVEFTNVLNRAQAVNPTATNAKATQVLSAAGNTGFGSINYTQTGQAPRQGQMVLRMTF